MLLSYFDNFFFDIFSVVESLKEGPIFNLQFLLTTKLSCLQKSNFEHTNLGGGAAENKTGVPSSGVQDDKKFDKRTLLARGDSQMVLLR